MGKKEASFTDYRYFPVSSRDRMWGLFVTTAGESRIRPGSAYPPSVHPDGYAFDARRGRVIDGFMLVYLSGGSGVLEYGDGERVVVGAGQAFLVFPGMWHRYAPDGESGWDEHWIGFDGPVARDWWERGFLSDERPVWGMVEEEDVMAVFRRVMHGVRMNPPALQQILTGAVVELAGWLYSARQRQPQGGHPVGNAVDEAIARMARDPVRAWDMPRMARGLGVSYSWFRRNFVRHTGLPPHQYLLELRLVRARHLLADPELAVKQVAALSGFEDEQYFCRWFRKKLHCTPGEWRRGCQSG